MQLPLFSIFRFWNLKKCIIQDYCSKGQVEKARELQRQMMDQYAAAETGGTSGLDGTSDVEGTSSLDTSWSRQT